MSDTTTPFANLQGHQFMNLFTYKRSGEAVKTPVWFAQEGDTLYVYANATSGKIKRIRNNGRVDLGPCDQTGKPLGPTVPAHARIIDGDAAAHADRLLSKKYGFMKAAISFANRVRGLKPGYVAIAPAPDAAS